MEEIAAGGDRCEFVVYSLIGLGGTLCTSLLAAPLGIVIGGSGLFLAATGACPTRRYEESGLGNLQRQDLSLTQL
jgi:hypothetical protein